MKLTATYQGQTFTRTTKAAYTHITVVRHFRTGELVDARWSKTAEAAAKPLPNGWEAHRVATILVGSDDTPAPEETPAADAPVSMDWASDATLKDMYARLDEIGPADSQGVMESVTRELHRRGIRLETI